MDHTTLVCRTHTWNGPKGSTFCPDWKESLSYMLAPCPDVIKPPSSCQHPEGTYSSKKLSPTSQSSKKQPVASLNAPVSTTARMEDKKGGSDVASQKDRKSRPTSAMEHHRRSLSLSTTAAANPPGTRRRCESYALSYSSSSEDSGSDSTSLRRGDHLPDAVPRSRARSIVLRKAKRRPDPPVRTVSLQKLTELPPKERRTQSLYVPSDAQFNLLLPDLIPLPKSEAGKNGQTVTGAGKQAKTPLKQSLSCNRPLNELRSSEPCRALSTSTTTASTPPHQSARIPSNSDSNCSPTSSLSSPTQPSLPSPSKLLGSTSPSSGYSSQCETPTQPVLMSAITGPSPLGCRMRPKSASSGPGQRARNCRARLSLQLPETQQVSPDPNPSPVQPEVTRRYSDASATTRPKQRLAKSMLVMPFVTQEDLNNVRLRSVSSSDPESTRDSISEVIEEESEREGCSQCPQQSPKAKPPVAPKPSLSKLPTNQTSQAPQCGPDSPPTCVDQSSIHTKVNKIKPKTWSPPDVSMDHKHNPTGQQDFSSSQSRCNSSKNTDPSQNEPQKKRKAPAPPVPRKPDMVQAPDDVMSGVGNSEKHVQSPQNYSDGSVTSPKSRYRVTVYGVIPSAQVSIGKSQSSTAVEYLTYDKTKEMIPDLGALNLVEEEDDVFVHKPISHTTEDLFTIIHRSKRKLFGRKDSLEGKQSDLGNLTLGGTSKTTSQNDNFMALLRRTRSAKATSGGRMSATEMLRSSKPPGTIASELAQSK